MSFRPSAQRSDSLPARHHHQPPLRKGTASASFLSRAFRHVLTFFFFFNLNAAVGDPPQPGAGGNVPAPHPVRHEPFQPGPLCEGVREVKSPRVTLAHENNAINAESEKVRVNLRLCLQPEGSGNREAGPREPCQNPEVSHYTPEQHGILGRFH